jgi:uncharacterized repeat protein (TIGR02543 family)
MKKLTILLFPFLLFLGCEQPKDLQDVIPPGDISNLEIITGDSEVTLSWANPSDNDFHYVEIWYGENDNLQLFNGEVESEGTLISSLNNGKTYSFLIKSFDTNGNPSDGVSTSVYLPVYSRVIYWANGAVGDAPEDLNRYRESSEVSAKGQNSLVNDGYSFIGWNTTDNGTGDNYLVDDTFSMPNSDLNLYAQWSINPTYTVTYYGNGNTEGEAPVDSNNYEQDTVVTISDQGTLVQDGYSFTGWNTQANGSGDSYLVDDTLLMSTADLYLYAQWVPLYTLTYNGNGNTDGEAPIDINNQSRSSSQYSDIVLSGKIKEK